MGNIAGYLYLLLFKSLQSVVFPNSDTLIANPTNYHPGPRSTNMTISAKWDPNSIYQLGSSAYTLLTIPTSKLVSQFCHCALMGLSLL